jgi:zinc transporter ZupT
MLSKAGMNIKQPVFYNVLSSILAFLGNNFSPWMFTTTASIFLYVAPVDMMPELSPDHSHPISSAKQQEDHCAASVGDGNGSVHVLVIALYEHDHRGVFSEGHHDH